MAAVLLDQAARVDSKVTGGQQDIFEKNNGTDVSNASATDSERPEDEYQWGVRQARAITTVWNRNTLWMMFVLLYAVSFVDMLLVSVQSSLNPYITSTFGRHGLLAAVSIVPSILAGTAKLTLAKILDLWGRIEGFILMLVIAIIGCIIKATAQSIQTYIAAHTLYWTAHLGLLYVIDVMLSDMTSLRNRMIILTVNTTPTIATVFAGPRIAELFYENVNFRWAFGAFAIIVAAISLPAIVIMLWSQRKAYKTGALVRYDSGRTWWQAIANTYVQMDITGIILITAAFALFLLPFSLRTYAPDGWKSVYIIAMLVLGFLLFPAFYAWERYGSPVPFLKWEYLGNPTILGSCFLYGIMFISIFCWNAYLNSYLQVVHQLSISNAGYVLNSFTLTSAVFSPFIAWIIRSTGNFKYTAYAGIPIFLIGTALLIPFRSPNTNVGVVAFTQILVGLGSGIFATCVQLAIMVPVTHQEIAAVLAIQGLFGSIGSSIGLAIAGAIWTSVLPEQIFQKLPEGSKDQAAKIYASLTTQLSYEWGSPEREAIVAAYGVVQRYMVIAGVCFTPFMLLSIYFWRNVNVKTLEEKHGKQTKGTVW